MKNLNNQVFKYFRLSQACGSMGAAIVVTMAMASLPAHAEVKGGKTAAAPWGRFQILENPQIRLTFLVQSAYLESVEKEVDQAPRISRFLMEKTSLDAGERKQAIKEYREWWFAKETGHNEYLGLDPRDTQFSSAQMRGFLESDIQSEPPSSVRGKRLRFVQMILESGFSDFTLAGFKAIERLEAEKDLGARLIALAEALGHMAKDEDRLETLASLSNLLLIISTNDGVSEANRKRLKPHAIDLSKKIDKAIRDAGLIDILNPAGLMGGAIVFKTVGQLTLKSPIIMKALGQWSKSSTVTKATIASAAGHAAILSSVSQPKDNNLEDISKEALLRLQAGIVGSSKTVLELLPGSTNDSISLDAARVKAEEILYGEANLKAAWKYAELIGYGERLLISPSIYDLSTRGLKTSDFIEKRDAVMLRFERYMAKRGLKVVDADALAMLKAFVDEYIPKHQDGQPFALVSTLRPSLKGNCVTRTLALTAMFYPAFLRYENPDLKFGIMIWENHIEAVLVNTKSKTAISIYSMTPLELKSSPSVLSPRALAATFLYRSFSPRLFGSQPEKNSSLYPRSRLVISKSIANPVAFPDDLTTSTRDRDPNPSPFSTALYADQLSVGDRKPLLDDGISTNPSNGGLRDVRNLLSALIDGHSSEELATKSSQALSVRNQAGRIPSQTPDPFTTALSVNEIGRLVLSRSPTKLPVLFVRADEWTLAENSQTFLRRKATPYRTPNDFEAELKKELKELQDNLKWRRLADREAQSFSEFTSDVDFQFEVMDFSEIITRLQGLNVSRSKSELSEYPFRFGIEDLLEVLGLNDQFSEVQKSARRLLAPITQDGSSGILFQFLKTADGMKDSDRVRQIQGLYVALYLSGQAQEFNKLLAKLEIQIAKQQPAEAKVLPRELPQFDRTKTKNLMVQLRPIDAKAGSGSGSESGPQEARIKMSLSAEMVFLLLHYFQTDVPDWQRLVGQIADSKEQHVSILKFSSKFFNWMPSIDVHGSWQNRLADGWVNLGQTACEPPTKSIGTQDCVTVKTIPVRTVCKSSMILPQKAPEKSKACDLLTMISSELIFD
jgi:hypothetical protein